MTKPILALRGINKSFGPIDVLHDITLEVWAGQVLCLLGDNGAGKSTLIKIMSGVHQATTGVIEIDGTPVTLPTPRVAADNGIATVHQFGGTFPLMSIGRSFFVGVEPTKGWGPFKVYDRKRANEIAIKAVQDHPHRRRRPPGRWPVGRRASVAGDRPCRPLWRPRPDPG